MKLFNPLHNLLLLIAAIFFIAAFLTLKKTLDIHMYSITYVIAFAQIFMVAAVYLSLIWLLYTFTARYLYSRKLYLFHIVSTVVLFLIIIISALWSNQWIESYSGNDVLTKTTLTIEAGRLIVGALLTLTIVQLLYPLNLIIGLSKNKKR